MDVRESGMDVRESGMDVRKAPHPPWSVCVKSRYFKRFSAAGRMGYTPLKT